MMADMGSFAAGGEIPRRHWDDDKIPAMLSRGTVVMRREAIDRIGEDTLRALHGDRDVEVIAVEDILEDEA